MQKSVFHMVWLIFISELSSHPIDGMEIWNNEETKDIEKKNNLTLIDKEVLNICLKKRRQGAR